MKIRTFLSLTVLTAALFFTLLTGSPTEARYCGEETCATQYNWCEASCNGRGGCIKACQREYSECMCSNCGLCPINDPPQAASKARKSAATPGTTKGQVGVTSGQAAP
jgi:hypothetical protein